MTIDDIHAFVGLRIAQLTDEEASLRRKLNSYRTLSLVCIVSGVIFPLLAGSTLLGSSDFFGPNWARVGGLLALLAAALTGLQRGLNCDAVQNEYKKGICAIRGLIEDLEATSLLDVDQARAALDSIDKRLGTMRSRMDVPPPKRRKRKAAA
jgi:hypothetical protein